MRKIIALLLMVASVSACAQEQEGTPYVAGRDYRVLDVPIATQSPGKIEVLEFFAYSCSHCFSFESSSREWKKTLGSDVEFVYSPAIWNASMEVLGRAYYTAKTLDVLDKVHQAMFNAIHLDRKNIRSVDDVAEIFAERGVDKEAVLKTFNSFGVDSMVKQADARFRGSDASGTPTLMVNGKYVVETGQLGHDGMRNVASYLVEKIRAGEM